jgi:protein TonB
VAHALLLWGLAVALTTTLRDSPPPAPLFVSVLAQETRAAAPEPALAVPPATLPRAPALALPQVQLPSIETGTPPQAPAAAPVAASPAEPAEPAPASASAPTASPPPPPAPERRLAIGEVQYLAPPVLVYPLAARRLREQGEVRVLVRVDERGDPGRVLIQRSSGSDRLDEAALATARATRFKPYTEDGVPRPFWVVMPLVFELT